MTPHESRTQRKRRVASGVLALIFMSILTVIAVGIILSLMNANLTVQAGQRELILKAQEQIALSQSITATWSYDSLTQTLEINVTNHYSQPITINRIGMIMPDKSIALHPPAGDPPLATTIDPGQTQTLTITGVPQKPLTITLHTTSQGIASATVSASEATTPGGGAAWQEVLLPTTAPENTTTWYGNAQITLETTVLGTPQTINVYKGSGTGVVDYIKVRDGLVYNLYNQTTYTIILEERNAIDWVKTNYHFTQDALSLEQAIPVTGVWAWDGISNINETTSGTNIDITTSIVFQIGTLNSTDYARLNLTLPSGEVWIMTRASTSTSPLNGGFIGIGMINTTGDAYAMGLLLTSAGTDVAIESCFGPDGLEGPCGPVSQVTSPQSLQPGIWYNLLAHYNPTTGIIEISLLDTFGANPTTATINDPSFSQASQLALLNGETLYSILVNFIPPFILIFEHYYQDIDSLFDWVFVSSSDPRYIVVKNDTFVTDVVVETPNGIFTATTADYVPAIGGFRIAIFPQNNSFSPVLPGSVIKVYNGATLLASLGATIMGGDVYRVVLGGEAGVTVDTVYYGSGLVNGLDLEAKVTVTSPVTVSATVVLGAYNYATNTFDNWTVATGIAPFVVDTILPLTSNHIDPTTNTSKLLMEIRANGTFQAQIDMLNINVTSQVTQTRDVLVLGHDSTMRVLGVPGSGFTLLLTLSSGLENIGWGADFTYSGGYIYVFNGTHLWRTLLYSSPLMTSPIQLGSAPGPSLGMVALEALETPSGPRLLALFENTTGSYYTLLDPTSWPPLVVYEGSLPVGLSWSGPGGNEYLSTANYTDGVYAVAYDSGDGNYWLVLYNATTDTWVKKITLSGGRLVGLAADTSHVYWVLEGGGVYRATHDTLSVETLSNPPFYPLGPSDRLEIVAGPTLWLVRASDTNELWYYTP